MKGEGIEARREHCKCTICEESWEGQGRKGFTAQCSAEQISARTVECHSNRGPPEEPDVAQDCTVFTLCLVTGYEKSGRIILCEAEVDPEVKVVS